MPDWASFSVADSTAFESTPSLGMRRGGDATSSRTTEQELDHAAFLRLVQSGDRAPRRVQPASFLQSTQQAPTRVQTYAAGELGIPPQGPEGGGDVAPPAGYGSDPGTIWFPPPGGVGWY